MSAKPVRRTTVRHVDGHTVEVRSSARRKRSVQAYRDGDRIVVLLPAALTERETTDWVTKMVARIAATERRRGAPKSSSDADLAARAVQLSATYLDGDAVPHSIRWVTNQNSRWGSCTPSTGTIRISHRLQPMPQWVIDYVILHELTHLLVPGHGPRFWARLSSYSYTERAQGFLEGVSSAAGIERAWPRTGHDDDCAADPAQDERSAADADDFLADPGREETPARLF